MQVMLNGKEEVLTVEMNVAEFLQGKGMNPKMIIVEYNGKIIKEQIWEGVILQNNDRLEVLNFVGGG